MGVPVLKVQGPTSSWMGLFAKVALLAGLPFGVVMAVWMNVVMGPWRGWGHFVMWGFGLGSFFGLFLSFSIVTLARVATGADRPGPCRQVRAVDLACACDLGIRRALAAMTALPGASAPALDSATGTLVKKTGMSWKSFGEVVTVAVEPATGDSCRVSIESRPRVRTTIVDYGVNMKNADAVANALRGPA